MERRTARRLFAVAAIAVVGLGALPYVRRRSDVNDVPPRVGRDPAPHRGADLAARPHAAPADPTPAVEAVPQVVPLDPSRQGVGGVRLRIVRGEDARPVADAEVVLHGTGHGGEIVCVAAKSAADGTVAWDAVPAGPALALEVRVAGESPVVRADVDVERGAARDLGVVRVGVRRTLRVTVLDDDAAPMLGARVTLRPLSAAAREAYRTSAFEAFADALPAASESATTDGAGRATFERVAPGAWLLEASAGARVPAFRILDVPAAADPEVPALFLRTGVELGGWVVDVEGRPVVGARAIAVWHDQSVYAESRMRHVIADAEGRFRLALPSTAFPLELRVEGEGHPRTRLGVRTPRQDLTVTLAEGAALELLVTDADTSTPLSDAWVDVEVTTAADAGPDDPWKSSGRADASGRFARTLPVGRLKMLRVHAAWHKAGIAPRITDDASFEAIVAPVEIEAGRPMRVEARLPARVHPALDGIVRAADGRPVAGVLVSDRSWGPWTPLAFVRTDASGAFHLDRADATKDKQTWLFVLGPGWVDRNPWPVAQEVRAGLLRAEIEAVPSATVRGRVVDEAGRPIPGASVEWGEHLVHGGPMPDVVSDADGRFALTNLCSTDRLGNPGRAEMIVGARGHVLARVPRFDVPAGRTVDTGDIVLVRGATVAGTVFDPSGASAAGVRLALHSTHWINPASNAEVHFAVSDARGRFDFAGVRSAQSMALRAESRRDGECSITIKMDDDAAAWSRLAVRLPAGASLEGVVVNAKGEPVPGAPVVFLKGGRERTAWSATTEADARGVFRFASVPKGPAVVGAFDRFVRGWGAEDGKQGGEISVEAPLPAPLRVQIRGLTPAELDALPTSSFAEWTGDEAVFDPPDDAAW